MGWLGSFNPTRLRWMALTIFSMAASWATTSFFQFVSHVSESFSFSLLHALYGNARHHGYNIGNMFVGNDFTLVVATFRPIFVQFRNLLFQSQLAVAIACSQFIVLA